MPRLQSDEMHESRPVNLAVVKVEAADDCARDDCEGLDPAQEDREDADAMPRSLLVGEFAFR